MARDYRSASRADSSRTLNHNAESQTNSYYPGAACKDASGDPAPCFATTSKGQFGYMALGKLRYQFRKVYGNVFRPTSTSTSVVGEWRGSLNIDGSRPMAGGQVDASSPYQPTDLCSAEYNGKTGAERMPSGCNSVSQVAGYNKTGQDRHRGPHQPKPRLSQHGPVH